MADDAPAVLHVAGDPEVLPAPDEVAVAIVGARRATPYGLEVARALGRGLAAARVTVVSGMALGIDAAAHAGALEVGGPTIAVLAGGADVPYPRSRPALHRRIVGGGGCVVSEMPPGFTPLKWGFPARNRIIAGLAAATIVVEAAERSGSLITAEFAQDLGRVVGGGARAGDERHVGGHQRAAARRRRARPRRPGRRSTPSSARARGCWPRRRTRRDCRPGCARSSTASVRRPATPGRAAARRRRRRRPWSPGLAELELLGLVRRGRPGARYRHDAA